MIFGHITNQNKKCDVRQNIFLSTKVIEAHRQSVQKEVQLNNTLEKEIQAIKIIIIRKTFGNYCSFKCLFPQNTNLMMFVKFVYLLL